MCALDQLVECVHVYMCRIHTGFLGGRVSGPLIRCLLEIPFEVLFMSFMKQSVIPIFFRQTGPGLQ